jgi:hypothetical protein
MQTANPHADNDAVKNVLRNMTADLYLVVTRDANSGEHDSALIEFRERLSRAAKSLGLDPKALDKQCPCD